MAAARYVRVATFWGCALAFIVMVFLGCGNEHHHASVPVPPVGQHPETGLRAPPKRQVEERDLKMESSEHPAMFKMSPPPPEAMMGESMSSSMPSSAHGQIGASSSSGFGPVQLAPLDANANAVADVPVDVQLQAWMHPPPAHEAHAGVHETSGSLRMSKPKSKGGKATQGKQVHEEHHAGKSSEGILSSHLVQRNIHTSITAIVKTSLRDFKYLLKGNPVKFLKSVGTSTALAVAFVNILHIHPIIPPTLLAASLAKSCIYDVATNENGMESCTETLGEIGFSGLACEYYHATSVGSAVTLGFLKYAAERFVHSVIGESTFSTCGTLHQWLTTAGQWVTHQWDTRVYTPFLHKYF
ncbi:hypothetical protein Pelo_6752 [Pelomyxa schiedti]|nr:hypothetical protein Pelo_6752 [Pelomyxa schiedti]